MANIILKELNKSSSIANDRARAELAANKAQLYMGAPVIREIDGTYQERLPIEDFASVIWFGQSDATLHADFVPFDPETGAGDIWIEVIL